MASTSPYLLITAGPTGSGKSCLPTRVAKYLNLDKDTFEAPKSVDLLVDNYIEPSVEYKTKINQIMWR